MLPSFSNAVRSRLSNIIFKQIKTQGFVVYTWPPEKWENAHKELAVWIKEVCNVPCDTYASVCM